MKLLIFTLLQLVQGQYSYNITRVSSFNNTGTIVTPFIAFDSVRSLIYVGGFTGFAIDGATPAPPQNGFVTQLEMNGTHRWTRMLAVSNGGVSSNMMVDDKSGAIYALVSGNSGVTEFLFKLLPNSSIAYKLSFPQINSNGYPQMVFSQDKTSIYLLNRNSTTYTLAQIQLSDGSQTIISPSVSSPLAYPIFCLGDSASTFFISGLVSASLDGQPFVGTVRNVALVFVVTVLFHHRK